MMTFYQVYEAQQRYEDMLAAAAKGRPEIEPATVTVHVLANAISAVKAVFAPSANARKTRTSPSRTAARRKLAAE